jgi:2-isopropylmalate synthase
MNFKKYRKRYFLPPVPCNDWVLSDAPEKAPIWCSVDLRDGNQALIVPMSLDEKIKFFEAIVGAGFREIEIGFPAASDTEFEFCRALIERDLIPDGVFIQVLTQSREHIIKRTFEALEGAKNVIVHLYNSTSVAQREQVFRKEKPEIKEIAVSGAKMLRDLAASFGGNVVFEYSPESFTGTEPEFALEVCDAVADIWEASPERKVIFNLPVTVEESMPHVFASQVEYMHKSLKRRDGIIISVHPHNDRGTAVSDCEMGMLAGADRIEGTLFGNGERTGNADIVTVALNLMALGIDPELNLTDLPALSDIYSSVTGMAIPPRQPYSGSLVFAAFSGSHQDAIAKGMKYREGHPDAFWNVPYLAVDPADIGREYEGDVIRINSQSGKGGIGFILEHNFGMTLPAEMRAEVGYFIKGISDRDHRELSPAEVYRMFNTEYVNRKDRIDITEAHFVQKEGKRAIVTITENGRIINREAEGNGRLDAVSQAVKDALGISYSLTSYSEHALERGSSSKAAAYVAIEADGKTFWGVGVHPDIIDASVNALVSAINNFYAKNL